VRGRFKKSAIVDSYSVGCLLLSEKIYWNLPRTRRAGRNNPYIHGKKLLLKLKRNCPPWGGGVWMEPPFLGPRCLGAPRPLLASGLLHWCVDLGPGVSGVLEHCPSTLAPLPPTRWVWQWLGCGHRAGGGQDGGSVPWCWGQAGWSVGRLGVWAYTAVSVIPID